MFLDERLMFKDNYCDFNGKKNLKTKRSNKKYYIYTNFGKEILSFKESYRPMELIDVVTYDDKQIIFYSDSKNKGSFIISKKHKVLPPAKIADKVEKTPMTRSKVMLMFTSILFFGILRFRDGNYKNINLSIGYQKNYSYKVHFLFPKSIRERFSMKTGKLSLLVHAYWSRIPLKDLYQHYLNTSEINLPVYIKVQNEKFNYYFNHKELTRDRYNKRHFIYNTISVRVPNSETEMYIRKSITGQYVFVITSYLNRFIIFKEKVAYLLTLFRKKKCTFDLYFEKFAQGASESGFELFKYAVDKNNKSIYILDKDYSEFKQLKQRYPKNLFAKNSLKSFYYIFLARSFISSDLVTHLQRRLYDNDSLFKRKILTNSTKVFLQHGPSLATDGFERGYHNRKVPIAPDYIVVNSNYEKEIFLQKSSYEDQNLLLTGQPNMDLYVKNKNEIKDQITFLLTWRPWDLTGKVEVGSYIYRYQQFINLIREDPFYHDKKINVVLHPKAKLILMEQFYDFYNSNQHYFYDGDIKEALLKSKVVITDYSSISYMAFSGRSNIIFYWEDKEKCEEEYGAPNILQKEIAFGDIIYDFTKMDNIIKESYFAKQKKEYVKTFDLLIETKEGYNTANTYSEIFGKDTEGKSLCVLIE